MGNTFVEQDGKLYLRLGRNPKVGDAFAWRYKDAICGRHSLSFHDCKSCAFEAVLEVPMRPPDGWEYTGELREVRGDAFLSGEGAALPDSWGVNCGPNLNYRVKYPDGRRYILRRVEAKPEVKADPVELLRNLLRAEKTAAQSYAANTAAQSYLDSLAPPREKEGRRRADWETYDGEWRRADGRANSGNPNSYQRYQGRRRTDAATRAAWAGETNIIALRKGYQAGKKAK